MRSLIIVAYAALVVSACARDNYTVIEGGQGSQAAMAADLKDCKHQAVEKHFQGRPMMGAPAAIGPVGPFIDAATTEPNPNRDVPINRLVEDCMRQKGYEGTSSG
jgi:hypothetical protein